MLGKVRQFTFEAKFDTAFPLWDNAGKIWRAIQEKFPKLEQHSVGPNSQVFKLGEDLQVAVELNRFYVVWFNNGTGMKDFYSACDIISEIVVHFLHLETYTRLGGRIVAVEEIKDLSSGTARLKALGVVREKKGKFFGITQTDIGQPEIAMRWEDEKIGITVRVSVEEILVNFQTPIELASKLEDKNLEIRTVKFDSDYYTKGKVPVAQVKASEWLKQVHTLIDNDLENFLKA